MEKSHAKSARTRRWFIYSLIGLFVFLCGGIVLAAILLLRRGKLPRTGMVTGSSMEPILSGPRFVWTCFKCSHKHEFAFDTCKSGQPFRCDACNVLDRESEIDFDDPDSIADRMLPGVKVRFASLRSTRESRAAEIATGTAQPSGLRRGDVVVFQQSLSAKREIKRVVGFPDEQISIEHGDVFVNGLRWHKTLQQSLRQSILLKSWDGTYAHEHEKNGFHLGGNWKLASQEFRGVVEATNLEDHSDLVSKELTFSYEPPHWIDNRVAVNAHDSHATVPVKDFGVAWQLSNAASSWKIRCKFHNGLFESAIELDRDGGKLGIQCGDLSVTSELPDRLDKSIWIVLAMIDGFLVAGNQEEEWLRIELPTEVNAQSLVNEIPDIAPISIFPIRGKMTIDQLLVFRDIHYRGSGDSASQAWGRENQIIVLGDNVSISTDSRDRWPEGLSPTSIKGVVLQTESPIEALLRQR